MSGPYSVEIKYPGPDQFWVVSGVYYSHPQTAEKAVVALNAAHASGVAAERKRIYDLAIQTAATLAGMMQFEAAAALTKFSDELLERGEG